MLYIGTRTAAKFIFDPLTRVAPHCCLCYEIYSDNTTRLNTRFDASTVHMNEDDTEVSTKMFLGGSA
jgi:hypothetical protein